MSPPRKTRWAARVAMHRAMTEALRQLVYERQLWRAARDRAWPRPRCGPPWQVGRAVLGAARWEARWRASGGGCLMLALALLLVMAGCAWAEGLSRLLRQAAAPHLSPEERAQLVEPLRLGDWALLLYLAFAILWIVAGG